MITLQQQVSCKMEELVEHGIQLKQQIKAEYANYINFHQHNCTNFCIIMTLQLK